MRESGAGQVENSLVGGFGGRGGGESGRGGVEGVGAVGVSEGAPEAGVVRGGLERGGEGGGGEEEGEEGEEEEEEAAAVAELSATTKVGEDVAATSFLQKSSSLIANTGFPACSRANA